MAQSRKAASPEDLAPLRRRIEIWRSRRPSRGETPAAIWGSAVALARIYGVCQIARAVGLDYKALRTRVAKAPEKPGLIKPTFVELPATPFQEPCSCSAVAATRPSVNGAHLAMRGLRPTQRRIWEILGSKYGFFDPIDRESWRQARQTAILIMRKHHEI
jgi:hypothetical protein